MKKERMKHYIAKFWYSDEELAKKCKGCVRELILDQMVEAHNHYAKLFDYKTWNEEFRPVGDKIEDADEWNSAYSAFIKVRQREVIANDTKDRFTVLTYSIDEENQLVGTVSYLFAQMLNMPELMKLSIKIYLEKVD